MDYYKILGLNKNATKEEIKESFRNIAKKFHPDKHSASPKSVKDGATLKFKQASEAYEVLVDDRKRADYNIHRFNRGAGPGYGSGSGSGYGNYGYGNRRNNNNNNSSSSSSYGYSYYEYNNRKTTSVNRFQVFMGYINSRAFLLNLAFAGAILSGLAVVEMGRDKIWKMHNPGKSFEEAMESVQKTKSVKEKE